MSGGNSAGSKGSRGGGSGVGNSGGGRSGRGGWEEAGSEFYQESYPGAAEIDGSKNNIATLLPSKQFRGTTVRRARPSGERRQSTAARGTSTRGGDFLVSMLPDLSENLSNEESTWEEIMQIKAMPVPMAQKLERKAQLQSATKLRLQGFEQLQWKRRKAWQGTRTHIKEALSKLSLWNTSFKKIEGNFGTGVVAYFYFLKWLLFLNFIISSFIIIFIIIPTIVLTNSTESDIDICDVNLAPNSTQCCSELYFNSTVISSNFILDIIQGTGWMEKTVLFYGVYPHKVFTYYIGGKNDNLSYIDDNSGTLLYYDLPLAYILIAIVYVTISLMAIVKSGVKGFKERLVEGEGQFYQYCNLIFGGWDFCIHNEKSANIKHKALYNEIKGCLERERFEEERQARSKDEQIKLLFIRIIINIIVLFILAGSIVLIVFTFNFSMNELHKLNETQVENSSKELDFSDTENFKNTFYEIRSFEISLNSSFFKSAGIRNINDINTNMSIGNIRQFTLEYLTSFCIVGLNIIVPILFQFLIKYENYRPTFVVKLTLLRTVFLRLSSLAVLLIQFYLIIINQNKIQCIELESNSLQCWETYVGQQFYKLLIADFALQIFVTFIINFPRSILARNTNSKCLKVLGEQEFHLPKHVLDVVYSQTLCWLGAFYCPILPLIATILCFFMFYIKKFACLVNSKPSPIVYRASRSNSLFMMVLLISYSIATIPVGYAIAELSPSKSCGPFRQLSSVWEQMINTFDKLPDTLRSLIFLFGTSAFAIPLFIILVLLLYYYWAVADANRHMVIVLKSQLVLEGHDKQFLLNRLSAFIRQQYKKNEKARQHHAHNNIDDDDSIRHSSK